MCSQMHPVLVTTKKWEEGCENNSMYRCLLIPSKNQTCPAKNSNFFFISQNFMSHFRPVESINNGVPLSNYKCRYPRLGRTKIRHCLVQVEFEKKFE